METVLIAGSCTAVLAFAAGAAVYGDVQAGTFAAVCRWHGSIDEQLSNIVKVTGVLTAHKTDWIAPTQLLDPLTVNCTQLCDLAAKCKSTSASTDNRELRNMLLKSTVGIMRILRNGCRLWKG